VALVLGAHANSRALNRNSPLIRDTVKTAISSFGFVSVISEDGSPDLIAAGNYTVPEQYRGNSQLLENLSEKKAGVLLAALEDVRADHRRAPAASGAGGAAAADAASLRRRQRSVFSLGLYGPGALRRRDAPAALPRPADASPSRARPTGTFRAERMDSARRTGRFTEPIRCRNEPCKKVFYTQYVNGFSWKCPFCGTIH
jgi:hypothetical protein